MSGGAGAGGNPDEGNPPPLPTDAADPGGGPLLIVLRHEYIGDTTAQGNGSGSAWKDFGFDLDGHASDGSYAGDCAPPFGSKPSATLDGNDGIDNSWGKNIIPLIGSDGGGSNGANQSITEGGPTIVFSIAKIDPAGGSQSPIALDLIEVDGTADVSDAAWLQGTSIWKPLAGQLDDMGRSPVQFPAGYLTSGTFVSGPTTGAFEFRISVMGVTLALPATKVRFSFDLAKDGSTAAHGRMGGIFPTQALVTAYDQVDTELGGGVCDQLASITKAMVAASDIMADGSDGTGKTCDGVSFGFAFDGNVLKALGTAQPGSAPPPPTDPCAKP